MSISFDFLSYEVVDLDTNEIDPRLVDFIRNSIKVLALHGHVNGYDFEECFDISKKNFEKRFKDYKTFKQPIVSNYYLFYYKYYYNTYSRYYYGQEEIN